MSDRLKFRVWDLVEHKYLRLEDWYIWDNCLWVGKYKEEETKAFNFNERYMVEQCTGLKDKNGNLVYEGDIVRCDRDFTEFGRLCLRRTVCFKNGAFVFKNGDGKCFHIDIYHNLEIIGNINENEELLDAQR